MWSGVIGWNECWTIISSNTTNGIMSVLVVSLCCSRREREGGQVAVLVAVLVPPSVSLRPAPARPESHFSGSRAASAGRWWWLVVSQTQWATLHHTSVQWDLVKLKYLIEHQLHAVSFKQTKWLKLVNDRYKTLIPHFPDRSKQSDKLPQYPFSWSWLLSGFEPQSECLFSLLFYPEEVRQTL